MLDDDIRHGATRYDANIRAHSHAFHYAYSLYAHYFSTFHYYAIDTIIARLHKEFATTFFAVYLSFLLIII